MASEPIQVSPLPVTDQLVVQRADLFFARETGLLSRLIRFFTRGIGESRHSWLIPYAVFLLTLLPSQANMLPAQSEKDIATVEEAEDLCRAGKAKKAKKKFNKLIERFPTWAEPLWELGLCHQSRRVPIQEKTTI